MTTAAEQPDMLRRAGAAVLVLGASELLGKVATLVTFLVMARLLGVADFGLLSLGLSLGLLLGVLPSLGLDDRLVQLGSARPELLDRCYGALVVVRSVIAVAVLAVTSVVLVGTMPAADATAVVLLVAAGLADTLTDAARAACGALHRQHLSAVVLVAQRFSVLLLTSGALLIGGAAVDAALGYLAGTVVGVLGMLTAARRAGARMRVRGSRREARLVLEAAPVTGVESVAAMGVFRIDAALIGVLLGTHAVGVYGASYRIFESVLFVSWTLSRVYMPVIARRPGDRQHVQLWARRALMLVCAVYLPYGVVIGLRGDDIVRLLFGEEYVHHGVLLGLAAAPLLFGITHLGASVLLALRPDPVVVTASVSALAVNVGLNVWLVPLWGITASAAATSVAFLLQSVILMRAVVRVAGSIAPFRTLVSVGVASAAAGTAVLLVEDILLALVLSVATFLVTWAAASRVVDPERPALRSLLSRPPDQVT